MYDDGKQIVINKDFYFIVVYVSHCSQIVVNFGDKFM